jgi:predicted  nucleic acid-binding Zn-ribbon protein
MADHASESDIARRLGQIHGQLYHLNEGTKELRRELRDTRSEVSTLRRDVTTVRETVARLEGRDEGRTEGEATVDRRVDRKRKVWDRTVEVAAAAGVILGALAAIHGPF